MESEARLEIIAAYGNALAGRRHSVSAESDLPHPAEVIHDALAEELKTPTHPDYLEALTVGFVQLASFIPEDDARQVQQAEDVLMGARDLIQEGTQEAHERAVEMVREIPAHVPNIQRRVRERMEARLKEAEGLMNGEAENEAGNGTP